MFFTLGKRHASSNPTTECSGSLRDMTRACLAEKVIGTTVTHWYPVTKSPGRQRPPGPVPNSHAAAGGSILRCVGRSQANIGLSHGNPTEHLRRRRCTHEATCVPRRPSVGGRLRPRLPTSLSPRVRKLRPCSGGRWVPRQRAARQPTPNTQCCRAVASGRGRHPRGPPAHARRTRSLTSPTS